MTDIKNQIHLVQTPEWNEFKKKYGNTVFKFGDIFMLVKKIPFTTSYVGYAPKVNLNVQAVDFTKLNETCKKRNISFIRFDIPNILINTKEGKYWNEKLQKLAKKAPRNTFTQKNIYLDLTPDLETIVKNMHPKKRYNINYAQRRGVKVTILQNTEGFKNFWELHRQTADRQGFLTHDRKYYSTINDVLKGDLYYIQAEVNNTPTASWVIIHNDETIYYTYGGSDIRYNKFYPSDLVGFEAIKLGKRLNAKMFDMWGAEENKGFTDFKLRYGGNLVEYIPSYDYVVNKIPYQTFNLMYGTFWKLQEIKRKII